MAVAAFGEFSIRNYTAGMRKADANKCWPFGGDVLESVLPPIESRGHRWWCSELQISRSAQELDQDQDEEQKGWDEEPPRKGRDEETMCPPGDFVLPSMVSSMLEGSAGKMRSPEKPKLRTPKKRSILELFNMGPLAEDWGVADECENRKVAVAELCLARENYDEAKRTQPIEKRVKIPIRQRTRNRCVKKTKTKEDELEKKRRNRRRKLENDNQIGTNSSPDSLPEEEEICNSHKASLPVVPRLQFDSTVADISGKTKKTTRIIQRTDKAEKKSRVQNANSFKSFEQHEDSTVREMDASPATGKTRTTDEDQSSTPKTDLQLEKSRIAHGENITLSTLGSPYMRSLCRVFSDVLTAASVMGHSSDSTDKEMTKKVKEVENQSFSTSERCTDISKVADIEGFSDTNKNKALADMVDLNSPADTCRSHVEPDASEQKKGFKNDNDDDIVETILREGSPISNPRDVIPWLPLSGTSCPELSISQGMTRKRKTNSQGISDKESNFFSPEIITSTRSDNWLTRELPQEDRIPRRISYGSPWKEDINRSLHLNSQSELTGIQSSIQDRPNRPHGGNHMVFDSASRLPVQSLLEMVPSDPHNQWINHGQLRRVSGRSPGRVEKRNVLDIHSKASFDTDVALSRPGVPAMRLMGKNITYGQSDKVQQGSEEINAWVGQRSISCHSSNSRRPEGFLQKMPREKMVAHMASYLSGYGIEDEPCTSTDWALGSFPRSHHSVVGSEGRTRTSGNAHHSVYSIHPLTTNACLGQHIVETGVEAAPDVHQTVFVNSGSCTQSERLRNPWRHLPIPPAGFPAKGFSRCLEKKADSVSRGVVFPGIPLTSSVRPPYNLCFQPAPMFTSLSCGDFVENNKEKVSTFGNYELFNGGTIRDQPPVYKKRGDREAFQESSVANDCYSRYCPTKLSLGAKHIFDRSLETVDREKPKTGHTTVHYSCEKVSFGVLQPREKSVRRYQL